MNAEEPDAELVERIRSGDDQQAAELVPVLYRRLRELSRVLLQKLPPGQTLQTTDLVHEAYLRLVGTTDLGWDGRRHFFGAAAQAMREILVREARRKASLKRGGGRRRVDLDGALAVEPPGQDVLALDEALRTLERDDERKSKIVLLRFYGGLRMDEIASLLEISLATVEREWRFVRVWLQRRLGEP